MSAGLEQFWTHIWGNEPGTVFLASKREDLFRVSKPQIWPTNKDAMLAFVNQANAFSDPYYTPGIFEEGSTTKDKSNGWRAKCLWVDLDGYKDGQGSPQAARQQLAELGWLPEPTYEIETSSENANHWYWILDDYYPAEIINDYNRRLAYFLNGDTACWDISHVMRPPYTTNHKEEHKRDGVSPSVSIVQFRGTEFSISEFTKLPPVKEKIAENLSLGTIPEMTQVMMHYPWDKVHSEILERDKQHFWDEAAQEYKSRGNAMVRLAFFCAEVGMPDEYIFAVVDYVDNKWGKFVGRNDRQKQLIAIVVKARTKYPSALVVQIQDKVSDLRVVYGFKSLLASEYKFNWIYEGFIPENTINFISARSGAGKSRFVMQLCSALALGRDFLTYKLVNKRPHKVAMFSLEMGGPIIKKFAESLNEAASFSEEELETLEENFLILPIGEALSLGTMEGENFFKSILDDYKPEVVFIDAMSSLNIEELTESVAKKIMSTLKRYLNTHGVTFYLVHHNKKTDQASINKPPTLNDFYGNTYGATDAASILSLWKNPQGNPDYTELHELKTRIGVAPKPVILDASSRFTYSIVKDDSYVPPRTDPKPRQKQEQGYTSAQPDANHSEPFSVGFGLG